MADKTIYHRLNHSVYCFFIVLHLRIVGRPKPYIQHQQLKSRLGIAVFIMSAICKGQLIISLGMFWVNSEWCCFCSKLWSRAVNNWFNYRGICIWSHYPLYMPSVSLILLWAKLTKQVIIGPIFMLTTATAKSNLHQKMIYFTVDSGLLYEVGVDSFPICTSSTTTIWGSEETAD